MLLDYVSSTRCFTLSVARTETALIRSLMREHGLDMSLTASNERDAVLFTREPYAAATFSDLATPAARHQLLGLITQIDASRKESSDAHIKCPPDQELWPFQKADVEYALSRTNTLVGDQPGLGKTPIAVCIANEIGARRVLVICPASIRLQWARRIREWTTMRWPYSIHIIQNARNGVHPTANWTIASYEMARSPAIAKALEKGTYDLLVLDEAHYLKTITAGRTRAIFGGGEHPVAGPLADRCGHILALTGTPLPNRPREAYTLARGLCYDAIDFMSEDAFGKRFNPILKGDKNNGFFSDERQGRFAELQNRLRANFMTRHLKSEVMTQLKPPIYDLIQVEETGPVRQALEKERLLDIDPETLEGADAEILGEIATVRRLMGVAIAPQVVDYVDMMLDGGEEKIVLFAWHKEVLDIFEAGLQKWGVLRVDGSTSGKQKEARVDAFIKDPRCQVIIGNTLSLGTGTDGLQYVANHALHAEPDWVPGNNEQCFDRLNRGGQQRRVLADMFVAPNSILERILASALRKMNTIDKALDRRIIA